MNRYRSKLLISLDKATPLMAFLFFSVLLLGLYFSRNIVIASLMGIGLGSLLSPVVNFLRRKLRIPKGVSASIVAIGLLAALAGSSYLIVNLFASHFVPMMDQFPQAFDQMRERLVDLVGSRRWLNEQLGSLNITSVLKEVFGSVFDSLQITTMAALLSLFIIAILVYSSVDSERYMIAFLSLIPAFQRDKVRSVLMESSTELRRWFLSQIVSMFFVGLVTGFGLWLIGFEQWLVLGFLTFLLEFIPYIGPIVATVLGVTLSLTSYPSLVLWVFLVFLIVQQLEGNLITPLIMKEGVNLPPVHLIVLAALMGAWFGLMGVFVAAPLLTVARVVYLRTYGRNMDELKKPSDLEKYDSSKKESAA